MYITINYELISWIEQEYLIELSLKEAVLISLIDSFRRQNQKCQMSHTRLAEVCMCKKTSVYNVIRKLKRLNIIKVWYPPKQQQEQLACTFWLHEDVINIIQELQAVAKDAIGPVSKNDIEAVSTAVSKNDTHNKIIGDSESSLEEDSSPTTEDQLQTFLDSLNI